MNNDKELMQQALDALQKNWRTDESDKAIEALRARLAQPELEPVAWMHDSHVGFNVPLYTAPPHFIDPAKVARLMDEAFERGKKEIDIEQVKDIAQKLADCALLNSAPPQREWQGLTDEECLQNPYCAGENDIEVIQLARAIEAKLKEKNNAT